MSKYEKVLQIISYLINKLLNKQNEWLENYLRVAKVNATKWLKTKPLTRMYNVRVQFVKKYTFYKDIYTKCNRKSYKNVKATMSEL